MDVGQALTLIGEPGADPLEVMAACERLIGFAQARQLSAIRELSEQQPEGLDPFGQVVDPVPAEVACYLSWTPWTASRRVDLAHDLHEALPAVLDALQAGELDLAKVQEIAKGTGVLSPGDRVQLADRAIGYGRSHTRAQLRAWLARQAARIDPEAAERGRKQEQTKRRVWVQPEAEGMATLGAYLTAEEAQACFESLHAAAANHEGGVDAARADLFVQRLSGLSPADPVPVQLLVTPTGGELAGYGPLSPPHFAQLAAGASRIALKRPSFTIAYAPTAAQKTWIRARDRHCRFPGCRRPAVQCDSDHILEYPTGRTEVDNLHCLCRYHHRLKTHTGWTVKRHPERGTETWTSPRGHRYESKPDDP